MNTISIIPDTGTEDGTQYRAMSGGHQSVGRTMGEALDALTTQMPEEGSGVLVLIQKRQPDRFFTAEQHERMRELMRRRDTLTEAERAELESLVDAEFDATVARTDALLRQLAAAP